MQITLDFGQLAADFVAAVDELFLPGGELIFIAKPVSTIRVCRGDVGMIFSRQGR